MSSFWLDAVLRHAKNEGLEPAIEEYAIEVARVTA